MIVESIEKFRERVNDDRSLQPAFLEAFAQGPAALATLAKTQGFEFSEAEASSALAELSKGGDLSDFELELVSGGAIHGSTLSVLQGGGGGANVTINPDGSAPIASASPPPPPPPASSSGGGK